MEVLLNYWPNTLAIACSHQFNGLTMGIVQESYPLYSIFLKTSSRSQSYVFGELCFKRLGIRIY